MIEGAGVLALNGTFIEAHHVSNQCYRMRSGEMQRFVPEDVESCTEGVPLAAGSAELAVADALEAFRLSDAVSFCLQFSQCI